MDPLMGMSERDAVSAPSAGEPWPADNDRYAVLPLQFDLLHLQFARLCACRVCGAVMLNTETAREFHQRLSGHL